jgi:hypothetical protein
MRERWVAVAIMAAAAGLWARPVAGQGGRCGGSAANAVCRRARPGVRARVEGGLRARR